MNLQQQILDGYDSLVIFSMNTSYRIMTINRSGQEMLKQLYGQHAKKGDSMLDLFEEGSSRSLAKEHFDRALNGENFTITRPNGSGESIKYYNIMYAPLREKEDIIGLSALVVDITENRKQEEQRLLNETKFKNIFEGVSEGILVAGYHKGNYLYANPAILKLMGYEEKEVINFSPKNVHNEKDYALVLETIKKSKYTSENKPIEVDFKKKDGSKFLGRVTYSVLKWEEKDCVVAFISDISELKKAEKVIQDSEIRYQALFEHSHDAIIILSESGKFLTGNEAVVKLFNADSLETCINTPPPLAWPEYQPDGRLSVEKADEILQFALKTGAHSFEWEYKKFTGEPFHASVVLSRIDSHEGILLQTSIRDITEQTRTKNRLKTQIDLQKLLMKISSKYINAHLAKIDQVVQSSLEEIGLFVKADRSYLFEFDYIHRTISNTFEWCDEGIKSVIKEFQQLPMHEVPDLVNPHFEGNFVNIPDTALMPESRSKELLLKQDIKSLLSVPLMNNNNCIGFVGFDFVVNHRAYNEKDISILNLYSDMLVNIQRRAEKEKELEKLLYTTKEQNKRLKEFSYITSHNIRSSVANMIGLSQMIKVSPGNEEYLEMLKVATEKLDNSITNINELINFENDNDHLEKVDCNLSEALQRVLKITNQILKQKEVDLTIEIENSHMVRVFPAYLDSIFHNLITNALKYGITDKSKKLDIYAIQEELGTTVFIKDQGLGIDLGINNEKMFKLGSRLHDVSDGQGLGLFMTKRQIEAMGGQIQVESQVGIGTTFKLFFQN